jgi:Tol biopolymer transport system component
MFLKQISLLAILALIALPSWGGRGGGGKPGGGEGGGDPTPADPAIAYTHSQTLFVMDADGANQTEVASASSYGWPSWSADGGSIVFKSNDGPIDVVAVDGTARTEVFAADDGHPGFEPAWSPTATPDGSEKILFRRVVESGGKLASDLWVVNSDGSGLANLTATPNRTEGSATWAADGKRIAVQVQDFGVDATGARIVTGRGLVVLHLAIGTGGALEVDREEVIVSDGPSAAPYRDLDWARTQDRILFSQDVDGEREILAMDLSAGATVTQLTPSDSLLAYRASWTKDDAQIVFERVGSGKNAKRSGLYVMDADGSNATSLDSRSGRQPSARR